MFQLKRSLIEKVRISQIEKCTGLHDIKFDILEIRDNAQSHIALFESWSQRSKGFPILELYNSPIFEANNIYDVKTKRVYIKLSTHIRNSLFYKLNPPHNSFTIFHAIHDKNLIKQIATTNCLGCPDYIIKQENSNLLFPRYEVKYLLNKPVPCIKCDPINHWKFKGVEVEECSE